jgi:hypothetical protein
MSANSTHAGARPNSSRGRTAGVSACVPAMRTTPTFDLLHVCGDHTAQADSGREVDEKRDRHHAAQRNRHSASAWQYDTARQPHRTATRYTTKRNHGRFQNGPAALAESAAALRSSAASAAGDLALLSSATARNVPAGNSRSLSSAVLNCAARGRGRSRTALSSAPSAWHYFVVAVEVTVRGGAVAVAVGRIHRLRLRHSGCDRTARIRAANVWESRTAGPAASARRRVRSLASAGESVARVIGGVAGSPSRPRKVASLCPRGHYMSATTATLHWPLHIAPAAPARCGVRAELESVLARAWQASVER